MTPEERALMRGTLREALGRALLPGASLTHPGPLRLPPSPDAGDLLGRFRTELTAVGGVVHDGDGRDEVIRIIRTIASEQPQAKALMWADGELPVSGLREALRAGGIEVRAQQLADVHSVEARAELATFTLGITGAEAGLAETGSLVLISGPGRSRLASLLPAVHIALLSRDAIVGSLAALEAARPELVTRGANFLCITGPSRTADIEHTLSRGVHGPKEVHVILI